MQSRARGAFVALTFALLEVGCGCPRAPIEAPTTTEAAGPDGEAEERSVDDESARSAIDTVLDGWHAAAARADEEAYFGAMTEDAIFLGTDATERWDKAAFRAYAHPHFAKGKAWSFRATRRDVILDGTLAWFDEDLATPNLGPARGSGVLRKEAGRWLIAHSNLAITVPNERFGEIKRLLEVTPSETSDPGSPPQDPADSSD
ncbi:MAG: nuclear transport factor 2 family protein [Polyangiaceae bacterium]